MAPARTRSLRSVTIRRTLVAGSAPVVGFALVAVAFAAWHARLPDPLATHMTANGRPDGFTSRGAFLPVFAALLLGLGSFFPVIAWVSRANPGGQRGTTATGVGLSGILTFIPIMLLRTHLDADDSSTVRFGMGYLAAGLGVLVVAAGLGWLLAGPPANEVVEAATAPHAKAGHLEARDSEVLVWTRRAVSPVLAVISVAMPVVGVVVGILGDWWPSLVFLGAALLTGAFAAVRVTANTSGLTVAYGPLPRPRTQVPLARISEAGTLDVRALRDFGGWGYRMRPGASGVILRSGEALSLKLATGSTFVVTVRDARTAASVINTLAARRRQPDERDDAGPEPGAAGGTDHRGAR
ncbi:DUF1648 domain-containing protein [Streptodolium elevatio]